jgi:hypothetical protein
MRALNSFFLKQIAGLMPIFTVCTETLQFGDIVWRIGKGGLYLYSSSSTYQSLIHPVSYISNIGPTIWDAKIPERIKFFLWLLS